MRRRVLIVANGFVNDAPQALPAELREFAPADSDMHVVVPMHLTRLQSLCSDIDAPRAERLRDERVEAEQQAHREHRDGEEDHARETRRGDRVGPETPDHQRIDGAHRDPSDLGDDERCREREHRAQFASQHR